MADPSPHLPQARQHNIHVRGYKEQGNINTPLELAIRNQTDRFSLAIDAIDRMPRFRVTGAGVREALINQRIACKQHAYEFGMILPRSRIGNGPFKIGNHVTQHQRYRVGDHGWRERNLHGKPKLRKE